MGGRRHAPRPTPPPAPHRDFKVGGAAPKLQKQPAVSLFHNRTCVSASARQKEHKNLSPKKKRKKTDNPTRPKDIHLENLERDNRREGWEDGTPPPHRDFKERSVVLAVAHPNPWSSASFYLPSQSLADSRCNLHATSRSSHSRRSPSCQFVVKSQGTWSTWSAVINRTSSGLGS